jgi:hypothetical protein
MAKPKRVGVDGLSITDHLILDGTGQGSPEKSFVLKPLGSISAS